MSGKKLYFFILILATAGYFWIFLNHFLLTSNKQVLNVCLFRNITGIPCPSCGTTHSVLSIFKGDFRKAVSENILGYPVVIMLLIFPVWIIIDLTRKRESFFRFYRITENVLKRKWVGWGAFVLLLLLWCWNLYRYFHS
jgi:hypothetical protein